ncbi:hypothetical protein FGA82_23345 [Pseudomonas fluorescens]|uniref:hypothetical protein n=1 Tax=Pseudomonas fluorescens TaxID=294 RepID=UPI0011319705|nr:hypothetical protein [Pseudomonas fluorescens]TMU73732.1 hypothetical protein FGA82_23345 [Pseudomonas fluorescens]
MSYTLDLEIDNSVDTEVAVRERFLKRYPNHKIIEVVLNGVKNVATVTCDGDKVIQIALDKHVQEDVIAIDTAPHDLL